MQQMEYDDYWGPPIFPDDEPDPAFTGHPSDPCPVLTPKASLDHAGSSIPVQRLHVRAVPPAPACEPLRLDIPAAFHGFLEAALDEVGLESLGAWLHFRPSDSVLLTGATEEARLAALDEVKRCAYGLEGGVELDEDRTCQVVRVPFAAFGCLIGAGGSKAADLRRRHPGCQVKLRSGPPQSVASVVRELEEELLYSQSDRPKTPPPIPTDGRPLRLILPLGPGDVGEAVRLYPALTKTSPARVELEGPLGEVAAMRSRLVKKLWPGRPRPDLRQWRRPLKEFL